MAHNILCWAAQVRVEQVLLSPPPLLLCFQASQLLAFYAATVTSLLGPGAQLAEQLASARMLARRVFGEQLKDRGDKLLRYPPSPPANLFPPSQARLVPREAQQLQTLCLWCTSSCGCGPYFVGWEC